MCIYIYITFYTVTSFVHHSYCSFNVFPEPWFCWNILFPKAGGQIEVWSYAAARILGPKEFVGRFFSDTSVFGKGVIQKHLRYADVVGVPNTFSFEVLGKVYPNEAPLIAPFKYHQMLRLRMSKTGSNGYSNLVPWIDPRSCVVKLHPRIPCQFISFFYVVFW